MKKPRLRKPRVKLYKIRTRGFRKPKFAINSKLRLRF